MKVLSLGNQGECQRETPIRLKCRRKTKSCGNIRAYLTSKTAIIVRLKIVGNFEISVIEYQVFVREFPKKKKAEEISRDKVYHSPYFIM